MVNATEVTPLPSNGALMGSNDLTVWLGNRLECLLILDDPVSSSGMIDPFTRQRTFIIVTSSRTSICSLVLSHDIDVCLFSPGLFIIYLINNFGLKTI